VAMMEFDKNIIPKEAVIDWLESTQVEIQPTSMTKFLSNS
jgi:hypothetical protein